MMTIPLHIQEVVLVRQSYSADRPGLPRRPYGGPSSDGGVTYRAGFTAATVRRSFERRRGSVHSASVQTGDINPHVGYRMVGQCFRSDRRYQPSRRLPYGLAKSADDIARARVGVIDDDHPPAYTGGGVGSTELQCGSSVFTAESIRRWFERRNGSVPISNPRYCNPSSERTGGFQHIFFGHGWVRPIAALASLGSGFGSIGGRRTGSFSRSLLALDHLSAVCSV